MSITKRTKDQIGSFRQAVKTTNSDNIQENGSETEKNDEESVEFLRKKMLEDKAKELMTQRKRRIKKNPLDVHSRNMNVTVSPRIEALWRHCANQEERGMSEWVRRAVDFYIRKHGMDTP